MAWMLRSTGVVRSEAAHTRSTMSGPGRYRRSFGIPLQRYSRSDLASPPRVSAMAPIVVLMTELLPSSSDDDNAAGPGSLRDSGSVHAGRLLAQHRDAPPQLFGIGGAGGEGDVGLEVPRREAVAVEGRVDHPAVAHVLGALGIHQEEQLHRPQRTGVVLVLHVDGLQVAQHALDHGPGPAAREHPGFHLDPAPEDPVQPFLALLLREEGAAVEGVDEDT